MKNQVDLAKQASRHLATLNVFAAVQCALEGGCVLDIAADKTAMRIIKMCKQEMQRQIKKHDAVLAKLSRSENLQAIADEYNAWIKHHAAGHDYDDFLAKLRQKNGGKA